MMQDNTLQVVGFYEREGFSKSVIGEILKYSGVWNGNSYRAGKLSLDNIARRLRRREYGVVVPSQSGRAKSVHKAVYFQPQENYLMLCIINPHKNDLERVRGLCNELFGDVNGKEFAAAAQRPGHA